MVQGNRTLTATVDPFLPQPPVNITRILLSASIADTAHAPYSGNVLTSSWCPKIGSYNQPTKRSRRARGHGDTPPKKQRERNKTNANVQTTTEHSHTHTQFGMGDLSQRTNKNMLTTFLFVHFLNDPWLVVLCGFVIISLESRENRSFQCNYV